MSKSKRRLHVIAVRGERSPLCVSDYKVRQTSIPLRRLPICSAGSDPPYVPPKGYGVALPTIALPAIALPTIALPTILPSTSIHIIQTAY